MSAQILDSQEDARVFIDNCTFVKSFVLFSVYFTAMTEISTFTSFGKRATCTVSRAGGAAKK